MNSYRAWLFIFTTGAALSCFETTAHAQGSGPTTESAPELVLETILGLLGLLGLAWIGGHPRVRKLEETLGISQAITAGFPFVALGVIARLPSVGILSDDVLVELTPLLHFGLGWLGFLVGSRFDVRFLDQLPQGTGTAVAIDAALPFITVLLAGGATMIALGGTEAEVLTRDALALATAGAMAAPRAVTWIQTLGGEQSVGVATRIEQLDEVAGILGLLFIASFFRPDVSFPWQLPGTVWLFVTVGLGVTLGVVLYGVVRRPASGPEFLTLTLGSVAFSAGLAGFLWLSPVVIGCVAGAVVANLPWEGKERLLSILERLERPIYLTFLAVVGASWDIADINGWILVPVFVAARVVGKLAAAVAVSHTASGVASLHRDSRFVLAPLSTLSIAVVVSVQALYSKDALTDWVVTAVVGGALLNEVSVQIFTRIFPPKEGAVS